MSISRKQYLHEHGLSDGAGADTSPIPWYYAAMQGIGAWFAAGMFLSPIFTFLPDSMLVIGLVGAGLLIGAAVMPEKGEVFLSQLTLAAALLGFAMVNVALVEATGVEGAALPLNVTGTGAAAYVLVRRRFFRFLLSLAVMGTWLVRFHDVAHVIPAIMAVASTCILAAFFVWRERRFLRPLGYAMAFAGPGALFMMKSTASLTASSWVAAVFGLATVLLLMREHGWRRTPTALGALCITALSLAAPGAGFGAALAVLGHAYANRLLEGVGLLWVPVFVSWFYYWLGYGLLTKSLMLMGAGLLLLGVRQVLRRRRVHA